MPSQNLHEQPSRFFTWDEVRCSHCKELPKSIVLKSDGFAALTLYLDHVREEIIGGPLQINSWYRCPHHPIEAEKRKQSLNANYLGAHSTGYAVDMKVDRADALKAIAALDVIDRKHAWSSAWTLQFRKDNTSWRDALGLGVAQKGGTRYLHVDLAGLHKDFSGSRPMIWSY